MKNDKRIFIFLSPEGVTFSTNYDQFIEVDNYQVLGFAEGKDEKEAFYNFLRENEWILDTYFNKVFCLEVKHSIVDSKVFYIKNNF